MPPEKAPRPTPAQMALSGAPTAAPAPDDMPDASTNIVVIAARMNETAKKVRAARVQLLNIESDLKAMQALRDEEAAKVKKCQEEYDALLRSLNETSSALVAV